MITQPEIIELNPTVIYKNKLSHETTLEQFQYLDSLSISDVVLSDEMYLLDKDIFSDLKDEIVKNIRHYEKHICGYTKNPHLEITESWYRQTIPGNHQDKHRHPNSMLSGVVYLNVPDYSDEYSGLVIETGHFQFPNFQFEYQCESNRYNTQSVYIPVKTGEVILFPSWMEHYVSTNQSLDESRKVIAFNTFIRGQITLGGKYPSVVEI